VGKRKNDVVHEQEDANSIDESARNVLLGKEGDKPGREVKGGRNRESDEKMKQDASAGSKEASLERSCAQCTASDELKNLNRIQSQDGAVGDNTVGSVESACHQATPDNYWKGLRNG
jgi:hypothetical protein